MDIILYRYGFTPSLPRLAISLELVARMKYNSNNKFVF